MPTNTSYYGFPVPVDNDPADAPHDFLALAQKIEDTLKGGFQIPNGNLILGDNTTEASSRYFLMRRKTGTTTFETSLSVHDDGGFPLFVVRRDGAEVNRFMIGLDGALYTMSGGTQRLIPFATYATNIPVISWAAGLNNGSVAVTYPVGRFTQPPIVQAQIVHTGNYFCWVYSAPTPSATAVTIGARHYTTSAAGSTVTLPVYLTATQMTPTSATG